MLLLLLFLVHSRQRLSRLVKMIYGKASNIYLSQRMARFFSTAKDLFRSIFLRAEKPPVFSTKEGALRGFDPVCYFTVGMPQKGSADYAYIHKGAIWHFVSAENLSTFKANPGRFVPQFGGYCSFGMASGYKADTQPEAWTIVDGKLYMNYSLAVRAKWNEKQAVYIEKANKNWPKEKKQDRSENWQKGSQATIPAALFFTAD